MALSGQIVTLSSDGQSWTKSRKFLPLWHKVQ